MNAPRMQPLDPDDSRHDGRQAMLALQALVAANRGLAEAVTTVADAILDAENVTPGERGLLMLVRRHRALTVPRLAEHKGVSRQHVQVAANALAGKGLLAFRPNPAHKRSRLVVLTDAGRDLVKRIMGHEGAVMSKVASRLDPERTKIAAETLGRVLELVRDE